jgi:hypothetical protein
MLMTSLHQILAINKSVRASAERTLTDAYHQLQKPAPFLGLTRRYEPLNEDGEQLPPESTKVQTTVHEQIGVVGDALARYLDVTAAQEWTNCKATADVVVDGQIIIERAPVLFLLFLERKLVDLKTFIAKLPTLDPSEEWDFDTAAGCYATPVITTHRTKKVPRNHVKAEATDKHPAQVELYYEDIGVGNWQKKSFSGMLPESDRKALLVNAEKLQQAVKVAREAANSTEVVDNPVGASFVSYLFGPVT